MEKLKLTKKEIIEEFNQGKVIRKTCGVWNTPEKDGTIVKSVEQIESFYRWAYLVDVYKGTSVGVDYDLVGASGGDMF